jgi:hypothetical protein
MYSQAYLFYKIILLAEITRLWDALTWPQCHILIKKLMVRSECLRYNWSSFMSMKKIPCLKDNNSISNSQFPTKNSSIQNKSSLRKRDRMTRLFLTFSSTVSTSNTAECLWLIYGQRKQLKNIRPKHEQ